MLDTVGPDIAFVAIPPDRSAAAGALLVERRIPFLIEKPLAANDAKAPVRLAAAIEAAGLIVAVGYQARGLSHLDEVRARLAERPPHLVVGRWLGGTPSPAWWRRTAEGGGQVIEQATHLFDLARVLVGEAQVVAARSARAGDDPEIDVADATTALLAFESGALGTFGISRMAAIESVGIEFVSAGQRIAIGPTPGAGLGRWTATISDAGGLRVIEPARDPYEVQAEAFLDAVTNGDPARVLASYADALRTDRLTRAVVAATGAPG
jgi:predicted dehydrogenase